MQRRFSLGFAIPHKTACLRTVDRSCVRVSACGEQYLENAVINHPVGLTKGGVQRCFPAIARGKVGVRTLLQQKLAQPPVSMKRSGVQSAVWPEHVDRFPLRKQELDRAHIAVVRAPLHQGNSVSIYRARRTASVEKIKYQVRTPISELSKHRFVSLLSHRSSLRKLAGTHLTPLSGSHTPCSLRT